jgi:hypothetical protein
VATFGQPCFLPQIPRQEFPVFRFRLTPTTVAASPGIQSQIPGDAPFRQHSLRISLTASLFQGAEGGAKRFSEGVSSARQMLQIRRSQKLNCVSFEVSSRAHKNGEGRPRLQASQHELAEPYKYSNRGHTSSTEVSCILLSRRVRGREKGSRNEICSLARMQDHQTSIRMFRIRTVACHYRSLVPRDFACGLPLRSRPQTGSTRDPSFLGISPAGSRSAHARKPAQPEIPRSSGFRLRAPAPLTPANRLNLLK